MSGGPFGFLDSAVVKNVSCRVCNWKVPGVSGVTITFHVSGGAMASEVAERMPYLSQARYLDYILASSVSTTTDQGVD
jgi:hypothetical protein